MRSFGTYFWGLLFIVIGAVFIIRYAFHVNISIFKVVFGFILVYFGVSVIVSAFGTTAKDAKQDMVFENSNIKVENLQDEYNIIFSKSTVDLRDVKLEGKSRKVKVHVVFGDGTVRINPEIPSRIKASSAFGTANIPNNNNVTFGEYTYRTKGYKEGEPHLEIEANVVFGKLDITEW